MKRLVVIQAALFATACSLRPFTPSVSVAFGDADVPASRSMAIPSSREVAARWELAPTDPWARYAKSTLISSLDAMGGRAELPDVTELEVLHEAAASARRLGEVGLPPDTLWLLDLRGAASVAFSVALSRYAREPLSPVLTFNNWPSPEGMVPAEETLAALVLLTPARPAKEARGGHPFFLMDSWRLAYREDDPGSAYDNRYMLGSHELPTADELRQRGITRVVYVVESLDDTAQEEDDLHATLRAWQASGVGAHLVDLAWLSGLPQGVDWARELAPAGTWIGERKTLMDDPRFYARARGGFGAAYGRPLLMRGFSRAGGHGGGGFGGG